MIARASFAALVLALVGCDAAGSYRGDGKLIDNGLFAATDRYVLELGPARLETAGTASYRIENLPEREFVLGIKLTRPSKAATSMDSRPVQAVVALELRDHNGTVVLRREGPLNEWTWNIPATDDWAFIYGREAPSTYFTPRNGALRLTFAVAKADPSATAYAPMIVAKSGGWK
jgi:hypothetical protein